MEKLTKHLKSLVILMVFLFAGSVAANAQTEVKGVVNDQAGDPMIGVTVRELGTNNGVVTDVDGRYSLKAQPKSQIQFTYVGYKTIVVPASQASGTIVMVENAEELDEVVVVGYGAQKKVNLTGAVSAIDGERISSKPTTDAVAALQGEIPGLQVLRSSGEPGAETSGMRIRGFS